MNESIYLKLNNCATFDIAHIKDFLNYDEKIVLKFSNLYEAYRQRTHVEYDFALRIFDAIIEKSKIDKVGIIFLIVGYGSSGTGGSIKQGLLDNLNNNLYNDFIVDFHLQKDTTIWSSFEGVNDKQGIIKIYTKYSYLDDNQFCYLIKNDSAELKYIGKYNFFDNVELPEFVKINGEFYPLKYIDRDAFQYRNVKSNIILIPPHIDCLESNIFANNKDVILLIKPRESKLIVKDEYDIIYDCTHFLVKDKINYAIQDDHAIIINGRFHENATIDFISPLMGKYTITEIHKEAFMFCHSITTITLPDNITSIGENAFLGCSNLKEVYISKNIKVLPKGLFESCNSLQNVSISSGIIKIRDDVFKDCTSLLFLHIPISVKEFSIFFNGSYYTYDDYDLSSFKNNMLRLFFEHSSLEISLHGLKDERIINKSIEFNVESFYVKSFDDVEYVIINGERGIVNRYLGSKLNVHISESIDSVPITTINPFAFENSKITQINLPNSIDEIGEFAFHNCVSLKSINLPPRLKKIGIASFKNCKNIKNIIIPSTVDYIGDSAFANMSALEVIVYNPVKIIQQELFDLDSININKAIFENVGIRTEGTLLFFGKQVMEVPNNLFSLDADNANVTRISFDKDSECRSIPPYAFNYLFNLKYLYIPKSVEYVGNDFLSLRATDLFMADLLYDCDENTEIKIECEIDKKPINWDQYFDIHYNINWGVTENQRVLNDKYGIYDALKSLINIEIDEECNKINR